MSTHKNIDRICALALAFCLLVTLVCYNTAALGIRATANELGYEGRLFSTDKVHTVDIVIDDWDAFLATAQREEYTVCDVTIDGETIHNVGIRGKGNTSLSQVSSMNSQRYSFKVEFDQYDSTRTYHGLDKLCLNNLIQDNTLLKDFLTYQMMLEFGAAAPLCSFIYITVNGEDWGLYLAVEAIEDSFLRRNYGTNYGELYKPDSLSMGGGRGNGRDFDMSKWQESVGEDAFADKTTPSKRGESRNQQASPSTGTNDASGQGSFDPSTMFGQGGTPSGQGSFDPSTMFGQGSFDPSTMFGQGGEMPSMPEDFDVSDMFGGGFGGFGMGSSDVKLQYIDDDPDSYGNIFDSAKTDITKADKTRLFQSLKALSQMDSSAVNIEAVIRYFVVHNYVVNGDSYTGSMIHNYYLYEENGLLSMLPWDYNLAYGGFQGGNASSTVNDDIDAPLSCSGSGDRPMMDWLLQGDQYTWLYHTYFTDFLERVDPQAIIDNAYALIAPYVEKDPTKFCTYEEFEAGVATLKAFCDLRSQSVSAQLAGENTVIDASGLDLSTMGSMGMGGGFGGGQRGDRQESSTIPGQSTAPSGDLESSATPQIGNGMPQMPGWPSGDSVQQPAPNVPSGDGTQPDSAQTPRKGSMQRPDMGGMQFPGQSGDTVAQQSSSLISLGISAVVLLLGLLVAFKYKR